MGLYFLKFITAFDLLFLLKLRWPKNKFDPFFAFFPYWGALSQAKKQKYVRNNNDDDDGGG